MNPATPGRLTLSIEIEPAQMQEAEAILKLQHLCYQSEAAIYDDFQIPPLTQSLPELIDEFDTHQILAARLGGELVGSVRARVVGETCHIGRLIVHPRWQGRGIGTRLMQSIEDHCSGVRRWELFTGHRSGTNLRLYQRLGYRQWRRQVVSPVLELVFLEKRKEERCTQVASNPAGDK